MSEIDTVKANAEAADKAATGVFMTPEPPKVKGKPGPKPGAKAQVDPTKKDPAPGPLPSGPSGLSAPQGPKIESKVIAYPFVKGISTLGEMYARHPAAAMQDKEIDTMADAMGALMDKWMPTIMTQYGPEMMFAMALGQYGMRVQMIKTQADKARAAKEKAMGQSQADIDKKAETSYP